MICVVCFFSLSLLFSPSHCRPKLLSSLQAGCHVICDRYAYSGVAFSAAKGLSIEWCKAADEGLIAPDIVFYLDMPVEVALKRGEFGMERYEDEIFQRKVQEAYTHLRDKHWYTIDATQPVEHIQQQIQTLVHSAIHTFSCQPIRTLWDNTTEK
jgi:dTMP kinase